MSLKSGQVFHKFITVEIPIVNQKLLNTRTGGMVGFYWNSYSKYADLKMLKNMENLETFKLKRTVLQGF